MNGRLLFVYSLAVFFCLPSAFADASGVSFHLESQTTEATIGSQVPHAEIGGFDLSPDGKLLSLFVLSGNPMEGPVPEWLLIVSTTDSKVLKKSQIGTSPRFVQGYAPQIEFAENGKLLLVDDGANVSVFDAETLKQLRAITPNSEAQSALLNILTATKSPIAAIAFGTGVPVKTELDQRRVRIQFVDLASNKELSDWRADDVPMSISPNGKFIAVSNHTSSGTIMPVDIFETISGKKVSTLSGGFGAQASEGNVQPQGRIFATFLSDDKVLLTPDASVDQSGHNAGASLNVVEIPGGNSVQAIRPEHYGPTGRIAVSADQNTIVAISQYIPAKYQTRDVRLPAVSTPQMMVFSRKDEFVLSASVNLHALPALRIQPPLDVSTMHLSANGSVIAIAEKYGVSVYARKE
jgi:hypothetical protein